jgi:hypothetical protein
MRRGVLLAEGNRTQEHKSISLVPSFWPSINDQHRARTRARAAETGHLISADIDCIKTDMLLSILPVLAFLGPYDVASGMFSTQVRQVLDGSPRIVAQRTLSSDQEWDYAEGHSVYFCNGRVTGTRIALRPKVAA